MKTILDRLAHHAETSPTGFAYATRIPDASAEGLDAWRPTPWKDFHAEVWTVARALVSLGVEPGGTLGILSANRPEWTLGCLGVNAIGGAPAGIYHTCAPNQVAYIVQHAKCRVILVEDEAQYDKVAAVRDSLEALEWIVLMGDCTVGNAPQDVLTWDAFLARAAETPQDTVDARYAEITPDTLASLIYTSGTTGRPKGVMLTHHNITETARIGNIILRFAPGDTTLSYLPLAHIAEQMISIHMACYMGYGVYYAVAPEHLADHLKEVRPTIFFGVPRVWERIGQALLDRLGQATGPRATLARWALGIGARVSELRNRGAKPGGLLGLQYRIADRLILGTIRQRLGMDRVRIAPSGAAPISPKILELFGSLGIQILEVYGLSETCGPVSWNVFDDTRFGTVGPPIPDVQVRIADDGEVQVQGPNVFVGYYDDPEATAAVLSDDGWFSTGDLGRLDDGFLVITGRKKDLIITSGGKNIAPSSIERGLAALPLVAEAVVIGDNRRFLTAVLSLDPDAAQAFARDHNLEPDTPLTEHPELRLALEEGISQVNDQHARVEHVRDFRILPRNLSVDEGELTPTLKVRRAQVQENFKTLIDGMYGEESSMVGHTPGGDNA